MGSKLTAEFLGTFWLVLGGCGSAVLAGRSRSLGSDSPGCRWRSADRAHRRLRAGPISGGHFNPAVTFGLWAAGAFPPEHPALLIVAGRRRDRRSGRAVPHRQRQARLEIGNFAANGYGEHSPGKYSLGAAAITEIVMTFMFLVVILGATHRRAPVGFAGSRSASR
jgi:aquaporin Z